MHILIVDDNNFNRDIAQRILRRLGHQTTVVVNGQEAVNACQETKYDLIFMDLQMPILDGFEATAQIRSLIPETDQPIIVALTANDTAQDRAQCVAVGMDDFTGKPIDRKVLKQILDRFDQT